MNSRTNSAMRIATTTTTATVHRLQDRRNPAPETAAELELLLQELHRLCVLRGIAAPSLAALRLATEGHAGAVKMTESYYLALVNVLTDAKAKLDTRRALDRALRAAQPSRRPSSLDCSEL